MSRVLEDMFMGPVASPSLTSGLQLTARISPVIHAGEEVRRAIWGSCTGVYVGSSHARKASTARLTSSAMATPSCFARVRSRSNCLSER